MTWIRNHGHATLTGTQIDQSIGTVGRGDTLLRCIYGWSVRCAGSAFLAAGMAQMSVFFGVQTIDSGSGHSTSSVTGEPTTEVDPPLERWLGWEGRRLSMEATYRPTFLGDGATWTTSPDAPESDRQGQVLANTESGAHLIVYASFNSISLPPGLDVAELTWYANILYT